jgi:hypothetical protein
MDKVLLVLAAIIGVLGVFLSAVLIFSINVLIFYLAIKFVLWLFGVTLSKKIILGTAIIVSLLTGLLRGGNK